MTLTHEHPVDTVALLAARVGLVGVAAAGLKILGVDRVHGARAKRLVRLKINKSNEKKRIKWTKPKQE